MDAIGRLDLALGAARIDYWLFGGWAVDFWVARITRNHDDIDVAAWRCDYDRTRTELLRAGWRHTPVENEVVGTRYRWRSVEVEFTFVEARDDGSVAIPFPGRVVVGTVRRPPP
jgi:Aminoglycoside-2''-adenylyltransferase